MKHLQLRMFVKILKSSSYAIYDLESLAPTVSASLEAVTNQIE
jgi:hypothetical protein